MHPSDLCLYQIIQARKDEAFLYLASTFLTFLQESGRCHGLRECYNCLLTSLPFTLPVQAETPAPPAPTPRNPPPPVTAAAVLVSLAVCG